MGRDGRGEEEECLVGLAYAAKDNYSGPGLQPALST